MHFNVTFTRTLRVLLLYTNVIRKQWWHAKCNEIRIWWTNIVLSCYSIECYEWVVISR